MNHESLIREWTPIKSPSSFNRGAAAAVVHVLDYYIERDSGTDYGGILRSLQTTIIQDGFGGAKPGPPARLPAHEQEE